MESNSLHLVIDTSSDLCSVGIFYNEECLWQKTEEGFQHASLLPVLILEGLQNQKVSFQDLHSLILNVGPGSYTGLRVGMATAKAICYAQNIPLIAVPALEALKKYGVGKVHNIMPMIDARRMEVYTAIYDAQGHCIEEIQNLILDEKEVIAKIKSLRPICFVGNGIEKMKPFLPESKHFKYIYVNNLLRGLVKVGHEKIKNNEIAKIAYITPLYYKKPNITEPKKPSK